MYFIGQLRFIEFRVSDNNENPINGLTLSNFAVIFLRDTVACTDTLTLSNPESGLYVIEYTPSSIGHDYIDLYNSTYDLRIQDADDIYQYDIFNNTSGAGVTLNQNYGGTNTLQVTLTNPQLYTLYVYTSSNWVAGNTATFYALGATQLTTSGNWITNIIVPTGIYHIVCIYGSTVVVTKPFLSVD